MKFPKTEANLLLYLAVTSTPARPASILDLKQNRSLFHRPSEAEPILRHLAQNGFIAPCSEWPNIYLLQSPIAAALASAASTHQAYFIQDDSLARAEAQVCARSSHNPNLNPSAGANSAPPSPGGEGRGEGVRFAHRAESAPSLQPLPPQPCGIRAHPSSDHLTTAKNIPPSQLPSDQLMCHGAISALCPSGRTADQIVNHLEHTIHLSADPERIALWEEWVGWWHTVAKNNPDRIERAWQRAQRQPGGVRYLERWMRTQIANMAKNLG